MRGLTCTRRLYKDTLLFTAHSSGSVCMWVCASVCLKGFFHLKTQNTTSSLLLLLQTHTQTHKCAAGASLITLIALYAHTCVKHTKIIFSNIPKGIWDLNVDKRMEHNCVYFVCGGGVMGLLFCNLLLDPRGSWIATPDYLGAGASTRKVIPWRQIESLSRLSLFSLNFFILSHSPFIFFSISPPPTRRHTLSPSSPQTHGTLV